ncbi:MAG: carboxypeptidase M32 [Omnitrophica WOR_2 bacterium]
MKDKLAELKGKLIEINSLESILSLLSWDQSTYMPPGGAAARGRQMAYLGIISQQKQKDPEIGKLLESLQPYAESQPYDSDDASLIRIARRDYERAIRIPPEFMGNLYRHTAETFQVWTEARPANDFHRVQPYLEKTLDLSRQFAELFPGYEHIADPLIDIFDYGMKASDLRRVFEELRAQLIPIVRQITSQPPADDSCLRLHYPEEQQLKFGRKVIEQLGYDFKRGRVDKTHHPFTTKFSLGDVRITTRVNPNHLNDCLFSMVHEAGHAMYEQGIAMEYEGTPLASGTSAGVHESQSRLWENMVGRSRAFWVYFYPRLQAEFPELKGTNLDAFYAAVNRVDRSLIRTEADEVTYNLHILVRFGLELDLLEGKLSIGDLPEAWRARYQESLGILPPDDRDGVLQDVHWFGGPIGGAFQGYTLGNIIAAQFFASAVKTHPEIPAEMEQGRFGSMLGWLQENVYRHGRKFTPDELIQRATGSPLTIQPYISYLKAKYGELYSISL